MGVIEIKSGKGTPSSSVIAKSGIWYTLSNFLFRGIAFITTPIFARLLTKNEFGEFNNIISWIAILFIFTSCDLYTSIIRAKLDYENDLDSYALSVLTLGSIITLIIFAVVYIFRDAIFTLMEINLKYIYIMFLYLLTIQGYFCFITLERAKYRYKAFSIISGLAIVISSLVSVFAVIYFDNKLDARVYGWYIPYIVMGIILYFKVYKNGKEVKFEYYKYALTLSLPLVPHLLSMTILASSDKIMITKFINTEKTALYSVGYIIANIISILIDSLNKAWAPWFLDNLKIGKKDIIKKLSKYYYMIFVILIVGVLLISPEIILILGGEKYSSSINLIPPFLVGGLFQFLYTLYVQYEFFEKKMNAVAIATGISAASNIILNFIFIPKIGYVAAAYTTMASYFILFIIHYRVVCKLGYRNIIDKKILVSTIFFMMVLLLISKYLFRSVVLRYLLVVIIGLGAMYLIFKKRFLIKKFFKG